MGTLFKIFAISAIVYFLLQAGRAWGRFERGIGAAVPVTFDTRAETYNEIMLRNCLGKLK